MQPTPTEWLPLQNILRDIVVNASDGLTEYELLKQLQSPAYRVFQQQDLQDPLVLFQTHFIIFNALYHLKQTYLQEQLGILEISCLSIRLTPWQPGQAGLQQQDKLAEYYLNWQHLAETDQQAVEKLLDSFWQGLSGNSTKSTATMSTDEALKVLELTELSCPQIIKKQYRKMLHKHHPDKGGSTSHTRLLHQAYESLC
ncbi:DNA-J related domain-containing protein [Paraglaciecola sp. L3A3]|uniref:DNA-J related domain-containing protein n=1 Tax=Paraglaciecola sp. L3A3 TaxID=2686358 RepID=UPI00131BDA87|nr:DNA-J related domain-containing protein [Paraglaciecola sp. L3A3]